MDKKKINLFWSNRTKIANKKKATHYHNTYKYDLALINNYANSKSKVLDLGCGNCSLSNKLLNKVKYIKALDKYPEFLKYCVKNKKLETKAINILKYQDKKKYDLILLFGVINFFSEREEFKIYRLCKSWLKKTGILLIKHQIGINKEIIIDKYSQELKDNYYARYPHIKKMIFILKKYFKIKIIDIYPEKFNPWPNTHFYAFICKLK